MDSRSAATGTPDPVAIEFVRFCYHRRRVGWPELYDEMCAVAGRGLFRGFSADDLSECGIGFSLFDMPALSILAGRIVAEEQALRRPVSVTIAVEASGPSPVALEEPTHPTSAAEPSLPSRPTPTTPNPSADGRDERTFDVPVRLALVPSGA
jgi:hypothetical protein